MNSSQKAIKHDKRKIKLLLKLLDIGEGNVCVVNKTSQKRSNKLHINGK